MKSMIALFALLALPVSSAFATSYVTFPQAACNGGGGGWGPLKVEANACEEVGTGSFEVNEGGHCNGYRDSVIYCRNGKISGYELKDCFCD